MSDVTTWLTNNYNSYIDQYLTKQRQPDNEIWLVNRIQQQKHFCSKIMHNMRQRDYNHNHNILKLYIVLIQAQLTRSKAKSDVYCSKLVIRVASRIAERLKT